MMNARKTPARLSLVHKRVIVGDPSMYGEKALVVVEDDKEVLLKGTFQRFLLCRNEHTGLVSDVPWAQVIVKPGDVVRALYPPGVPAPPCLRGGVTDEGVAYEVYPAAPEGESTILGLTSAGHFIVIARRKS